MEGLSSNKPHLNYHRARAQSAQNAQSAKCSKCCGTPLSHNPPPTFFQSLSGLRGLVEWDTCLICRPHVLRHPTSIFCRPSILPQSLRRIPTPAPSHQFCPPGPGWAYQAQGVAGWGGGWSYAIPPTHNMLNAWHRVLKSAEGFFDCVPQKLITPKGENMKIHPKRSCHWQKGNWLQHLNRTIPPIANCSDWLGGKIAEGDARGGGGLIGQSPYHPCLRQPHPDVLDLWWGMAWHGT